MMTTMIQMMIMTMCGVVTRLSKEQMTLAHFGLHDKRSHQHSKKEELIHWLKVRRCASAIAGWYSQIERELLKEGMSGTWNQDHLGGCVCVICNSNISQLPTSNTPPNISLYFIGCVDIAFRFGYLVPNSGFLSTAKGKTWTVWIGCCEFCCGTSFREGGSRTTGGQCGLTAGVEQRPSFASFAHFWSAGLGEVQWGVAHILHHQSGGQEWVKWWKKISDKKGLTFCDPPPPGHLMWFTSMGGVRHFNSFKNWGG